MTVKYHVPSDDYSKKIILKEYLDNSVKFRELVEIFTTHILNQTSNKVSPYLLMSQVNLLVRDNYGKE